MPILSARLESTSGLWSSLNRDSATCWNQVKQPLRLTVIGFINDAARGDGFILSSRTLGTTWRLDVGDYSKGKRAFDLFDPSSCEHHPPLHSDLERANPRSNDVWMDAFVFICWSAASATDTSREEFQIFLTFSDHRIIIGSRN